MKFNLKSSLIAISLIAVVAFGLGVNDAFAAIAGTVTATGTDVVAGAVNPSYLISSTGGSAGVTSITITFPAGYVIGNGDLTTATVQGGIGHESGKINVNGSPITITSVTGSTASKTIVIVIPSTSLVTGTTSFYIVGGVTNPTGVGAKALQITTSADTIQTLTGGVTITAAAVNRLVITGTSPVVVNTPDELTVTAQDQYGNTCATGTNAYAGAKTLTFSGIAAAPDGTVSTVEAVNMGTSQSVTFTAGVTNGTSTTLLAFKTGSSTLNVSDGVVGSSASSSGLALTVNAGAATKIMVETAIDGSGIVVPAISMSGGTGSMTVWSISRDAFSNFVANVAADTWSLTSLTGAAAAGDLVAAGDLKSAVFSAHSVGSAVIDAAKAGLTSTDSAVISIHSPAESGGGGGTTGTVYVAPTTTTTTTTPTTTTQPTTTTNPTTTTTQQQTQTQSTTQQLGPITISKPLNQMTMNELLNTLIRLIMAMRTK